MADKTLPRTRAEAKALGVKHYFTGVSCLSGHVSSRTTSNWSCDACLAEKSETVEQKNYRAIYRVKNADRRREYDRQFEILNPTYQADYHKRNRAERNAKSKAWREQNPDYFKTYLAVYRAENRERINGQVKAWMKLNAAQQRAWHVKRNADKIRAIPVWADLAAIEGFYHAAAEITAKTGVQHDVDHIVPLRGKNVCGLHVHTNLQVITHVENIRKKNKFDGVV